MRSLLLLVVVFAAGIFFGHEFWPESHEDPAYHLRFHRGHLPYEAPSSVASKSAPVHGRILAVPSPTPDSTPTPSQP